MPERRPFSVNFLDKLREDGVFIEFFKNRAKIFALSVIWIHIKINKDICNFVKNKLSQ